MSTPETPTIRYDSIRANAIAPTTPIVQISGPMPPLAGNDFIKNWKNLGDLFDKIHMSMPASSPGSLTEAQTADLIAYVLSVGKYPTGTTELEPKMEPLTQITLEPK